VSALAERSRRERAIERGTAVVSLCRKCEIGATRRNAVYGEGDACAQLLVVGEGPGENEDKLGRPFVGRSGELLDRMLLAIDLPRESVFIVNTVKCRPTVDLGTRLGNRAPTPIEMSNCRPYLEEQIDIIRPRVILTLGAPAAKAFMGERFSITKQRGQWFDGPSGIPVIATFHPAYILRLTGGEMNGVKRLVWADLKAVRDRLNAPTPVIVPDPEQVQLFE
jgi:DNA polymerase